MKKLILSKKFNVIIHIRKYKKIQYVYNVYILHSILINYFIFNIIFFINFLLFYFGFGKIYIFLIFLIAIFKYI